MAQSDGKLGTTRKGRRKPAARKASAREAVPVAGWLRRQLRRMVWWGLRGLAVAVVMVVALVALFGQVNPPPGIFMMQERARLGGIERDWVPMTAISPHMARSAVAAEDANFCLHWGFDMAEIRRVIDSGANRGASTITQQVAKNVFLWHGRNWPRKAAEAALTPLIEATWSKRRILEVYLNVAEFDAGVFGVEAAARHYFNTDAAGLTARQAARLAAILPDPKGRNAARPSAFVERRATSIMDGAATIARDGRAACFGG